MVVEYSKQNEILRLYSIECMTVRNIAKKQEISVQAVYKILKKLQKKGLLKQSRGRGLKSGTGKGGWGFKIPYFRLHGMHLDIHIISDSQKLRNILDCAIKRGNCALIDNNTVIFYKEKLEIYQDKNSSFTGSDIKTCFNDAINYFISLLYKIEARYNISLVQDGYHNIRLVNGHLAEVNNGMAQELAIKKQWITIFGDDQKAWFKVDYSKNTYKEAETIHPKRHIDDAAVVFSNYMNDWRNNKPLNNSELQAAISKVTMNQMMFAKNIDTHMDVLNDMRCTLKDIRDNLENKEDRAKRIKKAYLKAFGHEMW